MEGVGVGGGVCVVVGVGWVGGGGMDSSSVIFKAVGIINGEGVDGVGVCCFCCFLGGWTGGVKDGGGVDGNSVYI